MKMIVSFILVLIVIINTTNGYYKFQVNNRKNYILRSGSWPPDSIDNIKKVNNEVIRSNIEQQLEQQIEQQLELQQHNQHDESSETILMTTLSGGLASFLISHELTSVLVGSMLANSLILRNDTVGDTTRTLARKIKQILDKLSSKKKIVKTPYRFESNKAGMKDANFWREAYSAVSYNLGNEIETREKHLLMLKTIAEEEERIILKQKMERNKNDPAITAITNKDKKQFKWSKFALGDISGFGKNIKASFDKMKLAKQQMATSISEMTKKELASSSSSSESFEFPQQQVSSMRMQQKGRTQLAAIRGNDLYDNDVLSEEIVDDVATKVLSIEPVITDNTLDIQNTLLPIQEIIELETASETDITINKEIIADEPVESIITNSQEIITNDESVDYTELKTEDINVIEQSTTVFEAVVDQEEQDRFNQKSDLERFRNWGSGIEWNKVKIQGCDLYYHIQKGDETMMTSIPKKVDPLPLKVNEKEGWIRDVLTKATIKSSTYNYYKNLATERHS